MHMHLKEITDPTMKLRLELAKLREDNVELRAVVMDLAKKVAGQEKILVSLIRKLGPTK
jgi:hypothetical protein